MFNLFFSFIQQVTLWQHWLCPHQQSKNSGRRGERRAHILISVFVVVSRKWAFSRTTSEDFFLPSFPFQFSSSVGRSVVSRSIAVVVIINRRVVAFRRWCVVNKFYGGILSARSAIGRLISFRYTRAIATKLYSRVPETRKKMDSEIPELSDEAEEHVKLENGDEVINARAQASLSKSKNRRCHCSGLLQLFGWPAAKSLLLWLGRISLWLVLWENGFSEGSAKIGDRCFVQFACVYCGATK